MSNQQFLTRLISANTKSTITFNEKGTVNVGGRVVEDGVTGTYQVNSDCTLTGSITYTNWNLTVTGTGVVVNGGKEISYIATSPSQVLLSGTVKKM